jgi:hypothetical protein
MPLVQNFENRFRFELGARREHVFDFHPVVGERIFRSSSEVGAADFASLAA